MNPHTSPLSQDDIRREAADDHGRYVWPMNGAADAEMSYRILNKATIAIDHTFVPPSLRGRGIAEKLVARGIADARAAGVKIVPICPYVAAQFDRHPEWADLRAEKF